MKRLKRWTSLLTLVTAICLASACGKSDGEASSDAEGQAESDATEGDKKAADDKKSDEASAKAEGDKGTPAAEAAPSASAEDKVADAKLKEMGPEEEAAVTKRCGDAFDNTVNIMQTAGAPPKIVEQMRQQRDKTVASCLEQAKIDPSGAKMIDCMLAARLPADIQTCTRNFGNIQPLKPPKGVGPAGK